MATTILVGAKISPSGNPGSVASGMPIGTVVDFAGPESSVPPNWLICDGREISRTSFVDLFNAIGTIWGAGNSSTTFNVPDLRGFIMAGLDNMGGTNAGRLGSAGVNARTLGSYMGNQAHAMVDAELPAHQHLYAHGSIPGTTLAAGPNYNANNSPNANSSWEGGGGAHNNTQPTRVYNKIIRALFP